jgi:tetratricopeptide (TPR) repeat protein
MVKPIVFISYSHKDKKDEQWKDRLVEHLSVLQEQGLLEIWEDRQLSAGADWHKDIQTALKSASIFVLLISARSLTSEYILHEEVARAIARRPEGVRIFPVVVEPCLWQAVPWLRRMNLRPKDGRPLSAGDEHQINEDLAALMEEIYLLVKRAASISTGQSFILPDPADIAISRMPDTGSRSLFGRELEMELLDGAWADPDTNIISLVAWGGVGKTALVNHWLRRLAQDKWRGAEKVYAWSFYRQGTGEHGASADEFIAKSLVWFGDDRPAAEGSQWGKGERLATLVAQQRTLLILDGLEPLQEPPHSGGPAGRLKEDSMRALLGGLAAVNPGLCVITSRLPVSHLTECELYTAKRIDLDHLSPEAGTELLKEGGAVGDEEELQQASIEFGGHALALTLLASYLRTVHRGQIGRRDRVDILKHDERQGGHAQRVMASYERWFAGKPELAVLRMIALFDRPADGLAIAYLREKSDIPDIIAPLKTVSEEDWKWALDGLREAKLIAQENPDDPEVLDAHPLVRGYFKQQLEQYYPDAWRKGNLQLFEYFSGAVPEYPDTKEEMYFLYRAVAHGCQADEHRHAFARVYYDRIQRRREFFAASKLGMVSADVEALACFFEVPWTKPVMQLTGRWRALLFGQAGYRLWMYGRLKEAVSPMKDALKADVERQAWYFAAIDADSLASICMALCDLTAALPFSEDGVKYAKQSGDLALWVSALNTRGEVLHHQGELRESREAFERAEELKVQGQQPLLGFPHSFGHRRRDLLLSQGEYDEVLDTAKRLLESSGSESFDLIDSALLYLSLGQAELLYSPPRYGEAKAHLELAMEYLLRAGRVVHIPRGRLALADLYLMTGELGKAKANLDEALVTATRNCTELHQADCHLKYARLYLELGDNEKARDSWAEAKEIIERCGYHLRDAESHLLCARLYIARGEKEMAQGSLANAKVTSEQMGYRRCEGDIKDAERRLLDL